MAQTSAERVAAHRERQKAQESDNEAMTAYVEHEVAVTRSQTDDAEKIERSRKYSQWRWQGVQDGVISAL